MRISRFYTQSLLSPDADVALESSVAHYISNVLRMKVGDPLVLFNGDGNDYSAQITELTKKAVSVVIDTQLSIKNESSLPIHLAQGVSKGDRMDFALQKSVELGVSEITPVLTEHCVVKLSPERWQKKHEQWLKIIIAACEQSGRNVVPTLHPVTSLNEWVGQSTQYTRLILSPRAPHYLSHMRKPQHGFRLLIGPEGGLSDQEVYTCEQRGFTSVNIGPRVLRTETAALASIAILQSLFGDL